MNENESLLSTGEKKRTIANSYDLRKYEACLSGGLRLIPSTPLLQALRTDYEKMIANGMFEGEPPNFESIVSRLQALEKQINAT